MKSKIFSLSLALCLAILPSTLHADNKTFTEADAAAPISINKGDTITFSLKSTTPGSWGYNAVAANFSDSTIPTNDPNASILSADPNSSTMNLTGTSISDVFVANNSGQIVLLFSQLGSDAVFKYQKIVSFIVNIK